MNRRFSTTVSPDLPSETSGAEIFADSTMRSRHVRIDTTANEALLHALGFQRSFTGSGQRDYRSYAEAAAKAHDIFDVLQFICGQVGCNLVDPGLPAISPIGPEERRADAMDRALRNWCDGTAEQMASNRIGRVEQLGGDALRYWFYEIDKESGLWTNNRTRTKSTHEIVNARAHQLPADHVAQPAKARRIVRRLMAVPELARSCRIITGMMVSKESHVQDQWQEDTKLAQGVKSAGRFVKNHAAAIGAGVGAAAVGTLATLAMLAKPVAMAATAVAVADPAIVLGDVVFYGWE